MTKLFSGRYILTLICGLVFAIGALNNIIPKDAVITIIMMVFTAYFNRNRTQDQNGGK